MSKQDKDKRLAGRRGAEEVEDGMLVGLGTGSTVKHTIERLGERVRDEGLSLTGVPTSLASEKLALEVGLTLVRLEADTRPDVTIDGADEIDHRFHMIKGGGGALLREKLVARRSARRVIVVDSGKRVEHLGAGFALPVEVVPFAWRVVKAELEALGGVPKLRQSADGSYFTDNGNHILDTKFASIDDPGGLHDRVNAVTGVVDNGLFVGMVELLVMGGPAGLTVLSPEEPPTLRTERLLLRPFGFADAREVQRLAGDRAIADTTLAIPHPYEDGAAESWIGSHQRTFRQGAGTHFAIVLEGSGQLLGAISLMAIDRNHSRAELGYWVGKPYWNQDYCTEAARAVVRYAFNELALERVFAVHLTRNPASGRVLAKLGMKHEGCQRRQVRKWETLEDIELYGILAAEFEAD